MSHPELEEQENVLGEPLEPCSLDPKTGYLRDGRCTATASDQGAHYLCAEVTKEFLEYSQEQGNDLITPRPDLNFPGLSPGDQWCLCVGRWIEAYNAGFAPPVVLEATNKAALNQVDLSTLKEHATDRDPQESSD